MALYLGIGANVLHPAANIEVPCRLDSSGTVKWAGCSFADWRPPVRIVFLPVTLVVVFTSPVQQFIGQNFKTYHESVFPNILKFTV
jgi:hypothetical protein